MKNLTLSLVTILLLSHGLWAQTVHLPDPNFKAALVNNYAININGDGEIQVAEAQAYDGAIAIFDRGISDLTGIEAFPGLDSLDCSYIGILSTLDVSANPALEYLICNDNQLASLDVSMNPALKELRCQTNRIAKSVRWCG